MFGLIGLVADLGYMQFIKMSAQTAAQAAASAAIIHLKVTTGATLCTGACSTTPTTCAQNITTPTNSAEHGCMYAQQHGFNSANKWVTYSAGNSSVPPTAAGTGTASSWITFRVIQRVPQLFSSVLGNTTGLVAARSSAALMGASDCIFALNATASGAVSAGGTSNVTSACGIYVNSNSASALSTNGGGTINATEYDVVGGVSVSAPLSPTENTGVTPIADPLAYLPVPATATYACDFYNYSASNGSNPTLNPGVYCGGINVGNNIYTLSAGTYIIVGGGLTTQSTNSTLNGTNVFIYNTFGATTTHGTIAYSPINLSANSHVSLKASNTGTYAGILIFEDRNAPASSDSYGGGANAVYQGTIYAKKAAVTMYGNSAVGATNTILVADTISFVGTSNFANDYSLLANGSPVQRIVVVE